jgi:hypothetical protein
MIGEAGLNVAGERRGSATGAASGKGRATGDGLSNDETEN